MPAHFETTAHAKCILAGEHAVLRGYPALVLPIHNKTLALTFDDSPAPLDVTCHTKFEETFLLLFWSALQRSLTLLNMSMSDLHGKFTINNDIEMGAGIGFSAALAVVISRWLAWEHFINEKDIYSFAHQLENLFHGQSSGIDVLGVMSDNIIHFETSGRKQEIEMNWQPKLYISYSGRNKDTSAAVAHVNRLRAQDPALGKLIDMEMNESVLGIEAALRLDTNRGLEKLSAAIEHAHDCFNKWGLVSEELQEHIKELYALGAIAAKPTGAGEGGYVLSLWETNPPENNSIKLFPVFSNATSTAA